MEEDHSQSGFMKDSSQSRADKSQGGQESMFYAWSWSVLSPRLWTVFALARAGSSSTPSSRSRKRGLCQQVRTRTLHHRQGDRLQCGTPSGSTLRLRQESAGSALRLGLHCACATKREAGLECLLWNVCSSTTGRSPRCGLLRKSRRPSWSRTTLSCAYAPYFQSYQPNATSGMQSPWTLTVLLCQRVFWRLSKMHKFQVHSEGGVNLDRPANCVVTFCI